MEFSLDEKLGKNGSFEEESNIPEHFTDWGSIISTVKDCLPTIDSDSEVSTLTENSDNDPIVFSRKVTDKVSPVPAGDDPITSCAVPALNDEKSTSSVLFERLQCQGHTSKNNWQEGLLDDVDLPIYDDEAEPAAGYSCLDENGNRIASDNQLVAGTDTGLAMRQLAASSVGKAPLLFSEVLDGYGLDEVLENIEENDEIDDNLEKCGSPSEGEQSNSELMGELISLSRKQSGVGETKPDAIERTVTTSRGVTADLPLDGDRVRVAMLSKVATTTSPAHPELSWSEPTTIYLDLRSKPPPTSQNDKERSRRSASGGGKEASARPGTAKSLHVVDASSSESDADDFEEWKRLRRKFKSSDCDASNADSPTPNGGSPNEGAQMKGQPAPPEPVAGRSSKELLDYARLLADPESEESKNRMRNIALQKVNEVKKKIRDRSQTHKFARGASTDGEPQNEMNGHGECKEGARSGMYASQRLKNTGHESGDTNVPNSVAKNKSHGKATVLFAEEPKKGEDDTMNIYRSKKMNEPSATAMQTDQPFPPRPEARSFANGLSCSTSDLKAAAQKLVEDKKQTAAPHNGDRIPKQWTPTSARDSYSILQKQRKQPALSTSSHPRSMVAPPSVPSDVKDKLCSNIQRMYAERFSPEEQKIFPLLYDKEISYEREISTIPDRIDVETQAKMVLLTFQMSSPGCVVMNRSGGSHRFVPVDATSGLSITYALLISWLLALIPDNLDKPHDPPREDVFTVDLEQDPDLLPDGLEDNPAANLVEVPFNAVSLHQIWQEETQTIATNALVIPNFFYKPDTNNRRKKPKKENAFLQVVWHFLQSNRIQEVCPWHTRPESPILYNPHEMQLTCATKPMSTYMTATNDPQLLRKALNRKPGFMWKLVKNDDCLPPMTCPINQLQTTVCLLQQDAFTYPVSILDLALRLQSSCLDIASVRLLYVTRRFLQKNTLAHMDTDDPDTVVPCVALAIRGKSAVKKMLSIIGPRDPVLAAMTDEGSLNGIYGQQLSKRRGDASPPTEMNVFHSPRSADRAQQLLVTWFAGRLGVDECKPYMGNSNSSNKSKGGKPSGRGNWGGSTPPNPSSKKAIADGQGGPLHSCTPFLVTSNPSRICLVISARFPPHYLGDIVTVLADQGFVVEGLRRTPLSDKKVAALYIPARFAVYFKPPPNPDVTLNEEYYEIDNWWLRPVTLMVLSRENSAAHQSGLVSNIQSELMYRMIHPQEEGHLRNVTNQCFHVVPYTDPLVAALGSMHKTPDVELSSDELPRVFYSDPELEQVVVLSLLGAASIANSGRILLTLLHGEFTIDDEGNPAPISMPPNDNEPEYLQEFQGFELLGIKYIPALSRLQAKELTPYEVGTTSWYESLPSIESSSVLMCALRRVNAYHVLHHMLNMMTMKSKAETKHPDLSRLMSLTPEVAYRQIRMFFCGQELFSDNRCRPLLKYLPPPLRIAQYMQNSEREKRGDDQSTQLSNHSPKCFKRRKKDTGKRKEAAPSLSPTEESIFSSMLSWPRPLFSVLIVKPDAFPRHFVKILKRIHKEGFTVVAARMSVVSDDQAYQIIPSAFEKMPGEQRIFVSHMTSGPSLVLCLQRDNAVRRLVELAGPSNPRDVRRRDNPVGKETWRAEFGIDEFSNAIHVSERYVSACEEQKLFFPEGLCCCETVELNMEQIPTPALDHVMCEDKMKGREVKASCDVDVGDDVSMSGMEVQSICVIITSPMITTKQSKRSTRAIAPPYVDVLEQLVTQGYELCALRLCWLRSAQAHFLYDIIESRTEKKKKTIDDLTSGPCLVMLMQRENGLLLFDSIIGSCLKRHSYQKHAGDYLRTQTTAQTYRAARYAFHRLENRHSVFQIVHKRALEWKTNEPF